MAVSLRLPQTGKSSFHCLAMALVFRFLIVTFHLTQSSPIECKNYSECSGREELNSSASLLCYGSYSCEGTNSISAGNETLNSNSIECNGLRACANVESMISLKQYCRAPYSCFNSTFVNTQYAYCQGALSCTNSIFNNVYEINAYGELSLINSIITAIDKIIYIQLRGHLAGYGANIECVGNSTCNIYCYSTGCAGLNTSGNGTVFIINASNDTLGLNAVVDINFDVTSRNADCTQTYDAYQQMYQEANVMAENAVGVICARGYSSCSGVGKMNISSNTLFCSGTNACAYVGLIEGHGNVYCSAHYACIYSKIVTDGNIICEANSACQHSDIMTSGGVFCSARQVKTLRT